MAISDLLVPPIFERLLKFFQKKFEKPMLDMSLLWEGTKKINEGFVGDSQKVIDIGKREGTIFCEFVWKYKLVIKNNSSLTAYRVRITSQTPETNKLVIKTPSNGDTIKANEEKIYECCITHRQEIIARESYKWMQRYPLFLSDSKIEIVVEYTNERRKRFTKTLHLTKDDDLPLSSSHQA